MPISDGEQTTTHTRAMLYLLPLRSSWVTKCWSFAFPVYDWLNNHRIREGIVIPIFPTDVENFWSYSGRYGATGHLPLSRNEKRYIKARIGINRKSILRHSLFSCSSVRTGGGGSLVSPPKSTISDLLSVAFKMPKRSTFSVDVVWRASLVMVRIRGTIMWDPHNIWGQAWCIQASEVMWVWMRRST